jgi:hypothetical protein
MSAEFTSSAAGQSPPARQGQAGYLILIEDLVREGRTEREIDEIVSEVVAEDERAEGAAAAADLPTAA